MALEWLTGHSTEPEVEPENKGIFAITKNPAFTDDPRMTAEIVNLCPSLSKYPVGKMTWYLFSKDMNNDGKIDPGEGEPMTFLNFWVAFYDAQMKAIDAKKEPYERAKGKVEEEIENVRERINARAKDYADQAGAVDDAKDLYDKLKAKYNKGLGSDFFRGDIVERELRAKMDAAEAKIVQLQSYDTFVYADDQMDITNPKAGIQHYPDVRVLIQKYETYISGCDKEIDRWEKRKDHNQEYYDKWLEAWNAYYNPEPEEK